MSSKAKAVPVEGEIKADKAVENQEKQNKELPLQEESGSSEDLLNDEVARRQEQRKGEWGTQCDRWLIRCQQKNKAVTLFFGLDSNFALEDAVIAVPKRIDQYFVQFEIAGREIWLNKRHIAGIGAIPAGD